MFCCKLFKYPQYSLGLDDCIFLSLFILSSLCSLIYLCIVCLYINLLSYSNLIFACADFELLYTLRARRHVFLAILHAGPNQGLSKCFFLYCCLFGFNDFEAACVKMSAMLFVIIPLIESTESV